VQGSVLESEWLNSIPDHFKSGVDLLVADFTTLTFASYERAQAISNVLKALPVLARAPTHVSVLVVHYQDFVFLAKTLPDGCTLITSRYLQTKPSAGLEDTPFSYGHALTVCYVFFKESLKSMTDTKEVNKIILSTYMNSSKVRDFLEEDSLKKVPLGEKSSKFFEYLAKLFLTPSKNSLCFGDSTSLLEALMVRTNTSIFFYFFLG
jgi:hypothetical protein